MTCSGVRCVGAALWCRRWRVIVRDPMSQETKTALDAALAAHIADTCGGRFVSSYVLIACADTFENDNSFYYQETSDSLPYHSALGLARYLMMSVEDDAFVGVSDDEG